MFNFIQFYIFTDLWFSWFASITCVIGGSNPIKGDLLVIGGSMLYAVSNVSEVCFTSVYWENLYDSIWKMSCSFTLFKGYSRYGYK